MKIIMEMIHSSFLVVQWKDCYIGFTCYLVPICTIYRHSSPSGDLGWNANHNLLFHPKKQEVCSSHEIIKEVVLELIKRNRVRLNPDEIALLLSTRTDRSEETFYTWSQMALYFIWRIMYTIQNFCRIPVLIEKVETKKLSGRASNSSL